MNQELIRAVVRKHYFLSIINHKDELLRYFTLDEGHFKMCSDVNFDEYVNRFRGEFQSVEDFAEQPLEKVTVDFEEYHKKLFLVTMRNYLSVLEEKIYKIEMGN